MDQLFRTVVAIPKLSDTFNLCHHIMMVGSCFSENIFQKLNVNKFKVISNPTGILYNPLSIMAALDRFWNGNPYSENELFSHGGLWNSFDHHSKYSDIDRANCIEKINKDFTEASEFLHKTDILILTFGSSFVYQLAENGRIVANCHKLQEKSFVRRFAEIDEISDICNNVFNTLLKNNPTLKIILTVSPVRHLRDSSHENCVSKSNLIIAISKLQKKFDQVAYFPSYEIMMDDLRDYRFYSSDMIHPSEVAIEYIWNRFREACIDDTSNEFINEYSKILNARSHRILFPGSNTSKSFISSQLAYLDQLRKLYPLVDFSDDYTFFTNSLV